VDKRNDDEREQDVDDDENVAGSRAGKDQGDGAYVGRTGSDDSLDVGETGAEARSEEDRG
jgi:hypothetical protein